MMGGDRMTEKDLADMMEAEEKRLGLYSPEFMERHFEIMRTADKTYNNACCPSWHNRKAVLYGRKEITKGCDIKKRRAVYGAGSDQW